MPTPFHVLQLMGICIAVRRLNAGTMIICCPEILKNATGMSTALAQLFAQQPPHLV
jgi:hypothetical protein